MRCCLFVTYATLSVALSSRAHAQRNDAMPGAQVRLTVAGAPRVEGTLTAVSRDSIVVATAPSVSTTLARAQVARVDVYEGRSHAAGAVKGALIMTAVGAALGAMQTPRSAADACGSRVASGCKPPTRVEISLGTAYFMGLLGEWIGGAIGSHRWRRAELRAPVRPPGEQAYAAARPITPGLRVRVSAPGVVMDDLEGTVLQSTSDSLVLATEKGVRFNIPPATITEIRRPTVSSGAGAKTGALWGLAVYGPMSPFATLDVPRSKIPNAIITWNAVGAGLGALIGAAKGKETWEVVPP